MVSTSASAERGSSSNLVKLRISAPWSFAVWIQSIHGRRLGASTGPVAPITTIGTRLHQELKMPIMPCISPTLECRMQPIGSSVALP
jgi:hypothetical protein